MAKAKAKTKRKRFRIISQLEVNSLIERQTIAMEKRAKAMARIATKLGYIDDELYVMRAAQGVMIDSIKKGLHEVGEKIRIASFIG